MSLLHVITNYRNSRNKNIKLGIILLKACLKNILNPNPRFDIAYMNEIINEDKEDILFLKTQFKYTEQYPIMFGMCFDTAYFQYNANVQTVLFEFRSFAQGINIASKTKNKSVHKSLYEWKELMNNIN